MVAVGVVGVAGGPEGRMSARNAGTKGPLMTQNHSKLMYAHRASVRARAARSTEGVLICGRDLNTDPKLIVDEFGTAPVQLVMARTVPRTCGDCVCVSGLRAFQKDSLVGVSWRGKISASDAHDAVVVHAVVTPLLNWNASAVEMPPPVGAFEDDRLRRCSRTPRRE